MHFSNSFAKNTGLPLTLAAVLALGGCTHLGTNVAGQFSCRAPRGGCQPLSVIDASAVQQIIQRGGASLEMPKQRISVAAADNPRSRERPQERISKGTAERTVELTGKRMAERTAERTLRVILPAHIDAAGTLHDEAVAWAVVETPRWTGELKEHGSAVPQSLISSLRKALSDAARRSARAAKPVPAADDASDADDQVLAIVNSHPLPPEDRVLANSPPSIGSAMPPAFPSLAASAATGAPAPVAEGSTASAPPRAWTPRPWSEQPYWPNSAAISAAVRAGRTIAETNPAKTNRPALAKPSATKQLGAKPNAVPAPSAKGLQ